MTSLRHYPLGETCPASPHAVVSSLPTMADVRGYEEGEPRVLDALKSGYPRFVVHELIAKLIKYYLKRESLEGRGAVLIPGRRAAQDMVDWVGLGVTALKVEEALYLIHFDDTNLELSHRARKFVQHTGCGMSSRQAEDLLCAYSLHGQAHPEETIAVNAQGTVESELAGLIGCETKDVLACASGMNAFYAGFRAVHEAQSKRGRSKWLQLGWLYLDSGCVLKEFLDEKDTLEICYDATDMVEILQKIKACGDRLACVVVECPTNPLIQVADLPRIAQAVHDCGGVLMVDPTIASVYHVNVLPYADLLVTSLTKYASHEGDVMIGALALNSRSPHYGDLVLRTSSYYQPPYARDLGRLASELTSAPKRVALMDCNAQKLAEYLRAHAAVKKVHYAGDSSNFSKVAKAPSRGGAMITIELEGDIDSFYDGLAVMKGPSFGTDFTLVCPFMFLAHYDLVTSKEGRRFLRSVGIDPNLIRISVGTEPIEEIIEVFEQALLI